MPAAKRGRRPDRALAERRRTEILDAAARLFAERGYADTDLDDLAGRLGVGKGTVYRYFPSKETLFFAAADRAMHLLLESVNGSVAAVKDPLGRIEAAIRAHLAWFDRNPWAAELLIQERAQFRDRPTPTYFAHRDANLAPWTALLRGLIAAGRIRRIPVARIVDVLSEMLYGVIFTGYFSKRRRSLGRRIDDVVDVAFHGIAQRRGAGR
ncbi:MAG: TetR/AcrR family transcriptional regulator [Candidatus Brocadiae bacterium]|nr:TetR/AcrR family transcriptional regulator [Candidatus Brocadiia bacterium]